MLTFKNFEKGLITPSSVQNLILTLLLTGSIIPKQTVDTVSSYLFAQAIDPKTIFFVLIGFIAFAFLSIIFIYRMLIKKSLLGSQDIAEIIRENESLKQDISKHKNIESSQAKRLNYEEGLSDFAQVLFQNNTSQINTIQKAFEMMLEPSQASRVSLYEHYTNEKGELSAKQIVEVCAPGVPPQIDNPDLQTIPLGHDVFHELYIKLSKGDIIYGIADDYKSEFRAFLDKTNVKSFVFMPVFVFNKIWGVFGFVDNTSKRHWSTSDIHILNVAAQILGNYIETKQTTQKLWDETDRSSQIINTSPIILIGISDKGKLTFLNPAGERITGYHFDDLKQVEFWHTLFPGELHKQVETFQKKLKAMNKAPLLNYEMTIQQKYGNPRVISWNFVKRFDAKGKFVELVGFGSDITDQKEVDKMKNEFTSIISHEFRSPLAIMQTSISTLKEEQLGTLNEKQKKIIDIATRQSKRLTRFVDNLLDLSRLESGIAKANFKKIEIGHVIKDTVNSFQLSFQDKNLKLFAELTSDLPNINADEDMVVQVLTNLINNAQRFASSKVIVRANTSDETVQMSVSDDGPGIEKKDIDKLFNKFVQITRPTGDTGYKGTGLGLNICKEIVRIHRGKIWVESTPGKGTTFNVAWPIATQQNKIEIPKNKQQGLS